MLWKYCTAEQRAIIEGSWSNGIAKPMAQSDFAIDVSSFPVPESDPPLWKVTIGMENDPDYQTHVPDNVKAVILGLPQMQFYDPPQE